MSEETLDRRARRSSGAVLFSPWKKIGPIWIAPACCRSPCCNRLAFFRCIIRCYQDTCTSLSPDESITRFSTPSNGMLGYRVAPCVASERAVAAALHRVRRFCLSQETVFDSVSQSHEMARMAADYARKLDAVRARATGAADSHLVPL